MEPPIADTPFMYPEARYGRGLLALIIAVLILRSGLVFVFKRASAGIEYFDSSAIGLLITIALCLAMWHGIAWARAVTVILFSLGLLVSGFAIFSQSVTLWFVAVEAQTAIAIIALALSANISDFIEFQRNVRSQRSVLEG